MLIFLVLALAVVGCSRNRTATINDHDLARFLGHVRAKDRDAALTVSDEIFKHGVAIPNHQVSLAEFAVTQDVPVGVSRYSFLPNFGPGGGGDFIMLDVEKESGVIISFDGINVGGLPPKDLEKVNREGAE